MVGSEAITHSKGSPHSKDAHPKKDPRPLNLIVAEPDFSSPNNLTFPLVTRYTDDGIASGLKIRSPSSHETAPTLLFRSWIWFSVRRENGGVWHTAVKAADKSRDFEETDIDDAWTSLLRG